MAPGDTTAGGDGAAARVPACPNCGRSRDPRFRPFCSARCRDSDLLRWFKGEYAIPATEIEPGDGPESSSEDR